MSVTKFTIPTLICAVLLIPNEIFSQQAAKPRWEAGLHAGGFIYQGDLTPHFPGSVETIRPGAGIFVTYIINPAFSARLLYDKASLAADESIYAAPAYRKQRNFSFHANVNEISLLVHWNIFRSNYDERKFEPYLFAGAGASIMNISRDFSRFNPAYFGEVSSVTAGLAVDAATPVPRVIPVVPVGSGLRYNLNRRIAINGEVSYRLMRTDYLDGFSMSADPNQKDHYASITIGVAYKFGNKDKYGCPAVN